MKVRSRGAMRPRLDRSSRQGGRSGPGVEAL